MKKLCLLLTIGLFSLILNAQEKELSWTPEFSMQFKSIGGTDLSPDGKYVAYTVREPIMKGEKSEYRTQIWVAATDGSMNVQYTRAEKSSTNPDFSPDGQQIAFLSGRNGKTQVWLMRLMGGEPEQLTDSETGVSSFQWSPDGKSIAFTASDPETEEEKKAKKEKSYVIEVDKNYKYSHLYTVNLEKDAEDTYPVQRLTRGDFHVSNFDWAPDGEAIVFDHKPNPKINTSRMGYDISVVPSDSGAVLTLVRQNGSDGSPKYSPDGKYIAFVSDGGQPEPIGLGDLYVIPANGGEMMAMPHTPDRNANLWGWSADSRGLIFNEAYHTERFAMMLPVEKAILGIEAVVQAKTLTPLEGVSSAVDYNPKTGQIAFVHQTTDKPAELYVADEVGAMPKQVSKVNSDIELPKMGKTEVITWVSPEDNRIIEGLLTYPVDYEPGKRYPAILQIHGGPAGVFTETFTGNPSIYLTQYFAEQGFFVLRPNPRGSSGYGKDFRYANFKDWGYGDYEDLMSGMDKLIKDGLADRERQVAMGWSYGGYMTSFLVTKTDRFKAASMGAGLPNLISMTTTTDIPDYLVGHMGGEFWDDYETYEKHSAMYRIKNVKTPTQVIHGANDLRVPFTQGQEFYVALDRMGVETEMIVLPRTPHGPREPKLLMQVTPRIMNWFEQHLKKVRP